MGTPTGTRVIAQKGDELPHSPRGCYTWRLTVGRQSIASPAPTQSRPIAASAAPMASDRS